MTEPIYRLNDIFYDWINNGVFKHMSINNTLPWADEITPEQLDLQYHGNHSGLKITSVILDKFIKNGVVPENDLIRLTDMIYKINAERWSKLYATLKFEYDPISNYDMIENESVNNKNTSKANSTMTNTGTVKQEADNTDTITRNTEQTGVGNNTNNIYGFNSTTAVPADGNVNDMTNTSTETGTNNSKINSTNTNDLTSTTNNDINNTEDITRKLTRSGNIGVTTSQQMIQSERDLWFWVYFDTVFKDVDKYLTINVY